VSEFLQRAGREIQERNLFSRGQKILVAVSGGADSMVLLHALNSLAPKFRWIISVAHFNHQLRGRASAADEKLVRKTAAALKLPVVVERADVKSFAKKSKLSIEMAARKLRHEFLARVARGQKTSVVALAHHADDQVELFFLRLLRGAGGEGLAGMKWRSPSPADKKITLVRPLLDLTKTELLGFARENKIQFRDDETNFSVDFLRNRIRNELLPLLQKNYQPGLSKTVLRLMEIVGAESEFVGATARQWLQESCSSRGDEAQIESGKRKAESGNKLETPHVVSYSFASLPAAVQRRVLQLQLTELGVAPDFDLIEQLRESPGKFVSVGPGLAVARNTTGKLGRTEPLAIGFKAGELKLKLSGRAGQADFDGVKFRWRISPQKKFVRPQRQAGVEVFDADKVGGEIVLRHWRAGDRFQPTGLKSPVKLQDLFVNAKVPAARRRALVLATTADGEIFWVESLRMGEKFKLTVQTRRKLGWNWSKGAARHGS
jgi:tRNA(Ile)-lysidine synthase